MSGPLLSAAAPLPPWRRVRRGRGVPGERPSPAVVVLVATVGMALQVVNLAVLGSSLTWSLVAALAPGAAVALLGLGVTFSVEARWSKSHGPSIWGPRPSAGLRRDDTALWSGTGTNRLAQVGLAVTCLVLVAVLAQILVMMSLHRAGPMMVAPWGLAGLLPLEMVLFLTKTTVRVHLGPGGVYLRGPLGWRRLGIPLTSITGASVACLGEQGLGMRAVLRVARSGRSAWVPRRGDNLVVDLTDGSRVVVGVSGAAQAAGLLNDLCPPTSGGTAALPRP
ncbi:MAG: hypothetical protein ACYDH5_13495 [Acidimicrobiales bacterium]